MQPGHNGGYNEHRDSHGRFAASPTGLQARDSFTAQHWNGQFGAITRSQSDAALHAENVRGVMGRAVLDQELAVLTGAPDGATVYLETMPGYIKMIVHHPWYVGASYRSIQSNADGPSMTNGGLDLRDDAPQGVGTRIFAGQVRAASAAGLVDIGIIASGFQGSPYNGYYTWPRLGFRGNISPGRQKEIADATGIHATTVHELMRTPEGRGAWLTHGAETHMAFDLAQGSESQRVLAAYMEAKGITV